MEPGVIDMCQVWRETERTARKQHRCDSCYRAIAPGTRYVQVFFVHDGHAKGEKSCLECYEDNKGLPPFCEELSDEGIGVLTPSCFPDELADAAANRNPETLKIRARLKSRTAT